MTKLPVLRTWTRADCANLSRPCPRSICRYNLPPSYEETEFQQASSCVLDLADRGGMTLDDVSKVMGCTRERVRQIEQGALEKMNERLRRYDIVDEPGPGDVALAHNRQSEQSAATTKRVQKNARFDPFEEEEAEDQRDTLSVSFFDPPNDPRTDRLVADRTWEVASKKWGILSKAQKAARKAVETVRANNDGHHPQTHDATRAAKTHEIIVRAIHELEAAGSKVTALTVSQKLGVRPGLSYANVAHHLRRYRSGFVAPSSRP